MAPGTEEARWKRKVDRLIYIVLDLTVWKEVMTWLNLWPKLGLRFRYVEIVQLNKRGMFVYNPLQKEKDQH
jgi:hypothetical protein